MWAAPAALRTLSPRPGTATLPRPSGPCAGPGARPDAYRCRPRARRCSPSVKVSPRSRCRRAGAAEPWPVRIPYPAACPVRGRMRRSWREPPLLLDGTDARRLCFASFAGSRTKRPPACRGGISVWKHGPHVFPVVRHEESASRPGWRFFGSSTASSAGEPDSHRRPGRPGAGRRRLRRRSRRYPDRR